MRKDLAQELAVVLKKAVVDGTFHQQSPATNLVERPIFLGVETGKLLGAWDVDFEQKWRQNLLVLLVEWAYHVHHGVWELTVYNRSDESSSRAQLQDVEELEERAFSWKYTPRRRDNKNSERIERFESLWGARQVRIAFPLESAAVPGFLEDLEALVRIRELADDLTREVASDDSLVEILEGEEGFPEGQRIARLHTQQERSRELVRKAIAHYTRNGGLRCRVCDFDFSAVYGALGEGFVEMHHTLPLSSLTKSTKNRVQDVEPVCANCHRMLHRRRPWLGTGELRELLDGRR